MAYPLCSQPLYDMQKVWYGWRPNLSDCLLNIIQLVPCVILWLIAPMQFYMCWKAHCKVLVLTPIFIARMSLLFIGLCSVFFELCDSTIDFATGEESDLLHLISSFTLFVTLILSGAIFVAERRSHFCSSPANFIFYIFLMTTMCMVLLVKIAGYYSKESTPKLFRIISYCVTFIVVLFIFVLICFRDIDHFSLETQEYACGMERASALSRATFSWLSAFMYSPNKDKLNMETCGTSLRPSDRCADNYEIFRYYWEQMQSHVSGGASLRRLTFLKQSRQSAYSKPSSTEVSRPPLLRILWQVVGHYVTVSWFLKLLLLLLEFADPWVLYEMINFISDQSLPVWNGAFFAMAYLMMRLIATAFEHQAMYYSLIAGMRSRSMLIAAIYRKILRMNNDARSQSSEGDIANLISVEVQKVCEIQEAVWVLVSAALTTLICIPILWKVMGKSVLSGISFLFLLIPACGYLIFFLQNIEERETLHRDRRLSLLNEVFNGIGFLKLHAWEMPYEIKIARLRLKELKSTRKVNLLNSTIEMLWTAAPFLVMFATFNAFLVHGSTSLGVLSAQKIFVTLSIISILRAPISQVPWAISNIIDAHVSFKRLGEFFMANDLDLYAKQTFPKSLDKAAVVMEYASFSWFTQGPIILNEIDLKINPGRTVAVFGRIGSGKSSLLSAILGDMRKVSGYVCTRGSFAYVPQDGWIQQMTISDNVLFGSDMDSDWYDQVLDACSLRPDLKTLDDGDGTLIGEGGVTLTAGQKQRITLARAVYQNADIYLLDEPLSAIDILVATEVFQQVIGHTGLLRKSTRIIATSQLQFLPLVDFILVMKDGQIVERGPYYDLIARSTSVFSQYVKEQKRVQNFDSVDEESSEMTPTPSVSHSEDDLPNSGPFKISRRSTMICRTRTMSYVAEFNIARMDHTVSMATDVTVSSVLKSVYDARGLLFSTFVCSLCAAATTFSISSNLILSYWSDDENLANATLVNHAGGKILEELNSHYLKMYGIFGVLEIAFAFTYNVADAYASTRASQIFHGQMLKKLMHAPMCVFYVTPIGRIMNRFSGDIDIVDHELPNNINELTEYFFNILGCICAISIFMPAFLIVVIILMIIYFRIEVFYASVARQTRRLDFVSRSNLFTLFTETVKGASVIRAFNAMDRMCDICDDLTDDNARFFFTKIVCDRWLGVRLDIMASVFVFVAMTLSVFSRKSLQPGTVGLCLSYATQITDFLDCFMWQFSEVTAGSVAVERVMEFSDIEQEKPSDHPSFTDPGAEWPSTGKIVFKSAFGRERHGHNPVLRGVNAEILAGEHIGVVGRTGTGKSALTRALFGLMELDSGSVEIDDVDIRTLPLHTLRSRLSILPQDPILFSGTLRHNLDPLNEFEDEELWKVLRLVALEFRVQAHPRKLKLEIAERGSNLSIGERRLICIARTLLRKSKVLVLDEATAHLDSETSSLVIQIFREIFKNSTIVIITHSLASIMDTDRTIVLDRGRVREFDSPSNLMKNPYGFFYAMAKNAGFVSVRQI